MGAVLLLFIGALVFLLPIRLAALANKQRREALERQIYIIRKQITDLANNSISLTPEEFFEMREFSVGGRGNPRVSSYHDFTGVYILFNKTKNMHYVGQGTKVFGRVNNHFTGKGNGDVYADYKYGDSFSIKMISLKNSKFDSLNELERNVILTYDSYSSGYNKTRGNYN